MADKNNGRGLVKGYIYVMVILTLLCAVGAAFLHFKGLESQGLDPVVKLQADAADAAKAAIDINGPLTASIKTFEKEAKGTGASTTEKEKEDTFDKLDQLLRDMFSRYGADLAGKKAKLLELDDERKKDLRSDKREFRRASLPVKLTGVTRKEYEAVVASVKETFGLYATVESLNIRLGAQTGGKRLDGAALSGRVEEFSTMYDVDFVLVWHYKWPPSAAAKTVA